MTRKLFTEIAGIYDRMNHLLSLGLDKIWRRRAARLADGTPATILDLACGTGDLAFALADAFPSATVLGLDLTPAMLDLARQKNTSPRITFAEANAEDLANPALGLQPSTFDLVSCAFGFRNFGDKTAALRGARTLLKSGGQLLVLEFFRPADSLRQTLTDLWLRILSRLLVPAKRESYDYLRGSMKRTVSEREFVALADTLGFKLQKRQFYFPCCSYLLFAAG